MSQKKLSIEKKAETDSKVEGTKTEKTEKKEKKLLEIHVTTDTICPWCYVGHKRLEKALLLLDHNAVQVKKIIHPFFLDSTLPMKSVNKLSRYHQKFGKDRFDQMAPRLISVGKSVGINFSYGGNIGNTQNSHRLLSWSRQFGKEEELLLHLYRSYFEEEKDIADIDTLAKIADDVGLKNAKEFLESSELIKEVKEEASSNMQESNITGVPYFKIQNYEVGGAQDPEYFLHIFQKLGFYSPQTKM